MSTMQVVIAMLTTITVPTFERKRAIRIDIFLLDAVGVRRSARLLPTVRATSERRAGSYHEELGASVTGFQIPSLEEF